MAEFEDTTEEGNSSASLQAVTKQPVFEFYENLTRNVKKDWFNMDEDSSKLMHQTHVVKTSMNSQKYLADQNFTKNDNSTTVLVR